MNEEKVEEILHIVKSKIDIHKEFKKAYNKQLAFGFSLFAFFRVGENKTSEILAFFLKENASHGQGTVFLKAFVEMFYKQDIDVSNAEVICEESTPEKRKLDIYIKLKDVVIAVENKIWADDQPNQLKDYAEYLKKESNGSFLLLYLTPYGKSPTEKSIILEKKEALEAKNQLKEISYTEHIFDLIDIWISKCEAENVIHFLKEFKKDLKNKFLGNNTLNMTNNIRRLIDENPEEIQVLVDGYKEIERDVISKLNKVGEILNQTIPDVNSSLEINKKGPATWSEVRYYKYSISKENNKVWIQFVQEGINLFSTYYFEKGTDIEFIKRIEGSGLKKKKQINFKNDTEELVKIFLHQLSIVNTVFN